MKKGMSPLLATLLLIAFAVSLGALVMSLGTAIEPSASTINITEACKETSITLMTIKEHPFICYDKENKEINLIVINEGNLPLNDLQLYVVGRGLFKENLLEGVLLPGATLERKIIYDTETYGAIKEITLVPGIKPESFKDIILCTDSSYEYSGIDYC